MKNISRVLLLGAAIAVGAGVGYAIATNVELRSTLKDRVTDLARASRDRVEDMTEEMTLQAARMTRNPKITQEWVVRQWESIGY